MYMGLRGRPECILASGPAGQEPRAWTLPQGTGCGASHDTQGLAHTTQEQSGWGGFQGFHLQPSMQSDTTGWSHCGNGPVRGPEATVAEEGMIILEDEDTKSGGTACSLLGARAACAPRHDTER